MDIKELHSFKLSDAVKFHDKLNPKLFLGNRLDPAVKKQLLVIAKDFLTELGVSDFKVKDITISGSNAAYSYTPYSDLDLHVLVDYNQFTNDDVYRELFTAKKNVYNDSHDIKIRGIPVELYMQDTNMPHVSLGEYSVLNDKWIKLPTKRRANFDQNATKAKYDKLADFVLRALKEKDVEKVKKALDIIKRYRKAGLDKGGEFSPENLAYKSLRSQGALQKLFDLRNKLHGKQLSLNGMYSKNKSVEEDIPVQKGPARLTRQSELEKTQGELGSGFFGTVYDEPESKTGVGTARKVSAFDRDEMTADGYYAYINKIMDLKNETNNPYLPQVYDAKVVKPKSVGSEPYFELELEKLSKWEDLSGNQLRAILEKMLDESFENEKKLLDVLKFLGYSVASDTIDEWLMYIILYFIRLTIKNPNFSLMGMKIRDPQLLEVTDMLRYLSKSGYGMDLHDQNIMVRNTKYGPQLVITDPLAFGQISQLKRFKQGNIKMDVRGVTIPPNYIIYDIHDKDKIVLRGYGSYEEIYQQFIELKNQKPYNDYEIAPMNQKASDEMDAKQASVKAKYKEKLPANPKYQLKPKHTYAVYDKDKTSNKLIGYVKANHDSEALGLARKKFPDVKNINVLPDLLGDPNDKFSAMLEEVMNEDENLNEISGYIPSKKQANDPRFKTALTVDIKPDSIQKNAKAFGFKVKRSGIPPQLRP